MRAVVQKVKYSKIVVDNELVSEIGKGLNVLLGIEKDDDTKDLEYMAKKIVNLRIFLDDDSKMNKSVKDVNASIHLISQFTLYGDARKGNRPSFIKAKDPKEANELYLKLRDMIEELGVKVEIGKFRSHMNMSIENDGPITILLDSKRSF